MNIGILASHTGTTAEAVMEACRDGHIHGRVCVVISNNRDAQVLDRARLHRCPTRYLSRTTHPVDEELDAAIAQALLDHGTDLVLLAGYMRKVGPITLSAFDGRVLNTHPALLPLHGGQGMYGRAVHQAVVDAGDAVTGATVHVVNERYDEGAIVACREVPVEPGDDVDAVEAKVRVVERSLLVDTLGRLSRGELKLPGGWTFS